MPGIKEKLKAANKKRKVKKIIKNAKKNTTVSPVMKKVASRTQDPVRSGSAGSGKVKKTTKTKTRKAADYAKSAAKMLVPAMAGMGLKKSLGYSKGGLIQYD
tara:strand:+ start:147 stop:452 length:306 start_codon:yes stop_codon:yes gene_type:complete